jgi:streptogramin lyase
MPLISMPLFISFGQGRSMNRLLGWGLIVVSCLLSHADMLPAAEMQYPLSIAAGENGTAYVADRNLPGVWKVADGKLELLFEGSRKFRTPLNAVRCVAVDPKGRLVAGDTSTRDIYRFNADNKPEPLTKGGIGMPMAIAFNAEGEIFVCDLEIHRIVKVPEAGGEPTIVAEVPAPRGIAVDPQNRIWVVSHGPNQIVRILPDGKIETVVTGRPFQFPHTLVLDKELNAYLCDGYGKTVWKVGADGKPVKLFEGDPLKGPVGIALQGDHLLIADPKVVGTFLFTVTLDGKIAPLPYAK